MDDEAVKQIVEAALASAKYRQVCRELVERIAAQEAAKVRSKKDAIKATKNKLHQIGAAYQRESMPYGAWLADLREATDIRPICRKIMEAHASTRERLPILEEFYAAIWAEMPTVHSVLDVACGLNPMAIPWMGEINAYYAYDIYTDMMGFISDFLGSLKIEGHAAARDMGQFTPSESVDVALVLKTLPCLEQIEKTVSVSLLEKLKARHVVVSFPVHSLGGKQKGMVEHYEKHFEALIVGKNWAVKRFLFKTELVFLVNKNAIE